MDHAIQTRHLSKTYRGKIEALKQIDLDVRAGKCFGLLGPNGAGKSTLVKTLLSIVHATSGDATLLGRPFRDVEVRREVGYLPEGHAFPKYLTGRGVCRYFGALSGFHGEHLKKEVEEKLAMVGATEYADRRISKYSKGMKQRVGLAQALVGNPKIVFLDEPTDGVDPVGRKEIRDVIQQASDAGQTIFLNSHLLSEVEVMCDEIAIMHKGQIVKQGSVAEVKAMIQAEGTGVSEGVAVTFRTGDIAEATWGKLGEVERAEGGFAVTVPDAESISGLIDLLRGDGVSIYSITTQDMSLEDAFMKLIGELEKSA